jgi:hypothetical protein
MLGGSGTAGFDSRQDLCDVIYLRRLKGHNNAHDWNSYELGLPGYRLG